MVAIDTAPILENGAVLTKAGAIVDLELEGDRGLFFMSKVAGVLDTDRAEFDTRKERDEALLRTVGLYVADGWTLAGEEG